MGTYTSITGNDANLFSTDIWDELTTVANEINIIFANEDSMTAQFIGTWEDLLPRENIAEGRNLLSTCETPFDYGMPGYTPINETGNDGKYTIRDYQKLINVVRRVCVPSSYDPVGEPSIPHLSMSDFCEDAIGSGATSFRRVEGSAYPDSWTDLGDDAYSFGFWKSLL